jgi:integrase
MDAEKSKPGDGEMHRFQSSVEIPVRSPSHYFALLATTGRVVSNREHHVAQITPIRQAQLGARPASFVLYEFRHTYATRFYEATGDLVALARNLGNADLRTVMKYNHPQAAFLAKADEKFIATLGEPQVMTTDVVH